MQQLRWGRAGGGCGERRRRRSCPFRVEPAADELFLYDPAATVVISLLFMSAIINGRATHWARHPSCSELPFTLR